MQSLVHNLKPRVKSLFSYFRRHLQEQEDTLKKLMENRQIQQMKELETLFEKYVKLHVTISFFSYKQIVRSISLHQTVRMRHQVRPDDLTHLTFSHH